jgi:hypothetical protein
VLSRADINTGIVLDEQGNYALDSSQKVYTVFDDERTALEVAKKLIVERPTIECYIHKAPNKLLYVLDSEGIKKF